MGILKWLDNLTFGKEYLKKLKDERENLQRQNLNYQKGQDYKTLKEIKMEDRNNLEKELKKYSDRKVFMIHELPAALKDEVILQAGG